jgi:hypothetical protein
MGLFDRWRTAPEKPWSPPSLGSCSCEAHVEDLRGATIPLGRAAAQRAAAPEAASITVAELLDGAALQVRLAGPDEAYVALPQTGQRTGPYHWVLDLGDQVCLLYDEDAPVNLDDCLAVQPGIDRVVWIGRERLAVGAPGLCPSGVRAALVEALDNPRVRRTS